MSWKVLGVKIPSTSRARSIYHSDDERNECRMSSMCVATAQNGRTVSDTQITGASQLTTRESLLPLAFVTVMFSVWGFAGGLMDVMNKHFQETLELSRTESTGLQAAFFGAYVIGPLTYSGWIVRKYGYRWSFIIGLSIFGLGALLFWPSGHARSFAGFCGSSFVVGSGLATLETSAIPFVATCGPPRWSELRLNLTTAIQSVSTVSGLVLASYVILGNVKKDTESLEGSLATVQWLYLGVACFVFLLAAAMYFAPIPEITDADMDEQARMTSAETDWVDKPLRQQYTLFWGVLAAFCYTGSQVSISTFFINYIVEVQPGLTDADAAHRMAIAHAIFTFGRFLVVFLLRFVKPRYILLASVMFVMIFVSCAIRLRKNAGIAMIILEYFFKSCIGPTIFTLSIRGLGRHTKRGSSFLVASVSGGIVFAPAMGALADAIGTQKALVIPLAGLVVVWTFPIYLNLYKAKELDAYWNSKVGTGDENFGKARNSSITKTCAGIESSTGEAVELGEIIGQARNGVQKRDVSTQVQMAQDHEVV